VNPPKPGSLYSAGSAAATDSALNWERVRRNIEIPSSALICAVILLANITAIWDLGNFGRLACFALFFVICVLSRTRDLFHSALMLLFLSLYGVVAPEFIRPLPVLSFLLPFLLSLPIVMRVPGARATLAWMRSGRIDRASAAFLVLTGLISTGALIAWAFWTDNLGAGLQMVQEVSQAPLWMIGVGIPLFALCNAFAEEAVYRGVFQEGLTRVFGESWFTLALQASAFAAVHYAVGFPNGAIGYMMVFVYGVALGYLRQRTQGILAPFLAHVLADVTIASFLIWKTM
jgi:membrane protease YdiL (CAAX protease family)